VIRSMLISAVFLCSSLAAAAPIVSLTGTVVDTTGTGIPNARVSLVKYPDIVAFTDDQGVFTLTTSGVITSMKAARTAGLPYIANNRLCFTTGKAAQTVDIDMFASNGAKVFSSHLVNQTSGNHSIALPATASGIYFAQIAIGKETHVLKISSGLQGFGHLEQNLLSQSSSSSAVKLGKQSADAIADTIIAIAKGMGFGYKHSIKSVASYTENGIQIKLSVSNPWRPNFYPEKDKGMVKISAKGYDFEMGQPNPNIGGEKNTENESAVHTVTFTYNFWIDTVEVTQKDYTGVMAAYSNYTAPAWDAKYGLGDKYPAYCVSWADGALYCNARSKRDGFDTVYSYTSLKNKPGEYTCELVGGAADLTKNGYRLPTEAEWEYAYKGGEYKDFYWVQDYNPYPENNLDSAEISSYDTWKASSWDKGDGNTGYGTQITGKKINNNYCILNMAGNVSEWCNEYKSDSYSYDLATDPVGKATGSEDAHCIRGGNWGTDAIYMRAANRKFSAPSTASACYFQGFRCVRAIK